MSKKMFYVLNNVGRAKYVLNYHDGVRSHTDGSAFFDIRIFKNKKALGAAITGLKANGYAQTV